MPPDPLDTPSSGGHLFELPFCQTHCKLTLNSTGSRVLELQSVRRTLLVPKDRICKLTFF